MKNNLDKYVFTAMLIWDINTDIYSSLNVICHFTDIFYILCCFNYIHM